METPPIPIRKRFTSFNKSNNPHVEKRIDKARNALIAPSKKHMEVMADDEEDKSLCHYEERLITVGLGSTRSLTKRTMSLIVKNDVYDTKEQKGITSWKRTSKPKSGPFNLKGRKAGNESIDEEMYDDFDHYHTTTASGLLGELLDNFVGQKG